jgi:hypothetical protein
MKFGRLAIATSALAAGITCGIYWQTRAVRMVPFPKEHPIMENQLASYSYTDCYELYVPLKAEFWNMDQDELLTRVSRSLFLGEPKLVGAAMKIRDSVVRPFGLTTSSEKFIVRNGVPLPYTTIEQRDELIHQLPMQVGDRVGAFPVVARTSDALLLGFNDKHLDFRILVSAQLVDDGRSVCVRVGTPIHVNHWGGWVYLAGVLGPHHLLSRQMLANVALTV